MELQKNLEHPEDERLDLFDTQSAYAHLSNKELKKSYKLFSLMQSPKLVAFGSRLTLWALKNHLPVKGLIRNTFFGHFCGGETMQEALDVMAKLKDSGVDTVLDYAAEGVNSEEEFDKVKKVIVNNIRQADYNSSLSFISVKLTGLVSKEILEKMNNNQLLTIGEKKSLEKLEQRLDEICAAAAERNLIIYIDAEESWIQDPIDELTLRMMEKYNRKKPIVYNTFQMYRTDRLAYIRHCIDEGEKKGFIAGIKIVRGAYLEREQLRAKEMNYECPVYFVKEDTDKNFNGAIELCVEHLDHTALCIASHNEESTKLGVSLLMKKGLDKYRDRVIFSQLFGMSDHISYNLAHAGFHTSKYLPYGSVDIAMPYLIRRAQENSSVGTQTSRDFMLLQKEIKRRKL